MPKKFDQDAKDRVVCVVEDRILAENFFDAGSVQVRGFKAGRFVAHSAAMEAGRSRRGDALLSHCLKISLHRWPSCVERIKSCTTPTSC